MKFFCLTKTNGKLEKVEFVTRDNVYISLSRQNNGDTKKVVVRCNDEEEVLKLL